LFITAGPITKLCAGGDGERTCEYNKAVRGGRGGEDVCYGMPRAAAFVYDSDHHALVYTR